MASKTSSQNRIRDALSRIYDDQPPHFREYLKKYQKDPKSRVFAPLAEAYRKLGRYDDALEICLKGVQHHPDFHGGRVALARCYMDKLQFDRAREHLQAVIAKVPENLLAQRLLGDVHLKRGDKRAAVHCYRMALRLAPEDVGLAEKIYAIEREIASQMPPPVYPAVTTTATSSDMRPTTKTNDASALWSEPTPVPTSEVEAAPSKNPSPSLPSSIVEASTSSSIEPLIPTPEPDAPEDEVEEKALHSEEPVQEKAAAEEGTEAKPERTLPLSEEEASFGLARVLGFDNEPENEDAFSVQHVSSVFKDQKSQEITTETMADLYYSQGQYDRSLRIFERIAAETPSEAIWAKVEACREKLGVKIDEETRQKKIDFLQDLLGKVSPTVDKTD